MSGFTAPETPTTPEAKETAPKDVPTPETVPSSREEVKEISKEETKTPEEVEKQDKIDLEVDLEGPYQRSPLFNEVAQYFGIEFKDFDQAAEKLSVIVDYAVHEAGSTRFEDILTTIRSLENKIVPPSWSEHRYSNLYKYLRLASRKQSFEKAMSAYEK